MLVLFALVAGAAIYSLLSIFAVVRFLSARRPVRPVATPTEPISILKPLAGLDLDLESNLRTFFELDYPSFEILFAVREVDDPSVEIVERLQREYANVPTRLLITGEPPYANAKVFSLDRMLDAAENDLLVMSDSDIRVDRHLLRTVAAEFQDLKLGIATCPYRAVAGQGFWSGIESIGMNTDFFAGVLVARMLEGMHFAVGPTIAARRGALRSIGGFDRLKDYLAEDFVMGKFASEAGHGVILSSAVVEHHIGTSDFLHNAEHRVRWTRSTRRSRPWGYLGQLFTMPLPLAMAMVAADVTYWPYAAAAIALRFAVRLRGILASSSFQDQLALFATRGFGRILLLGRRLLRQNHPLARPPLPASSGRPLRADPYFGLTVKVSFAATFPNCIGKLVAP